MGLWCACINMPDPEIYYTQVLTLDQPNQPNQPNQPYQQTCVCIWLKPLKKRFIPICLLNNNLSFFKIHHFVLNFCISQSFV